MAAAALTLRLSTGPRSCPPQGAWGPREQRGTPSVGCGQIARRSKHTLSSPTDTHRQSNSVAYRRVRLWHAARLVAQEQEPGLRGPPGRRKKRGKILTRVRLGAQDGVRRERLKKMQGAYAEPTDPRQRRRAAAPPLDASLLHLNHLG